MDIDVNNLKGMCYGMNDCDPSNSYIEVLIPYVMILGDGTLGGNSI